ncbi:MAG: DUF6702 family protein [Saprospiraceae bacterium]
MNTILTILLLTNSLLSTSQEDLHKFYMSVTEIEYNSQSQSVEMTIRLFTDDFETALESSSNEKIRLGTKREHTDTDKYIQKYLKNHIEISVNNQAQTFDFIGKEAKINNTYCYIEIPNISDFESINIKNLLLFDLFDGQKNIVHVKSGKMKKSLFLTNSKNEGALSFKK